MKKLALILAGLSFASISFAQTILPVVNNSEIIVRFNIFNNATGALVNRCSTFPEGGTCSLFIPEEVKSYSLRATDNFNIPLQANGVCRHNPSSGVTTTKNNGDTILRCRP